MYFFIFQYKISYVTHQSLNDEDSYLLHLLSQVLRRQYYSDDSTKLCPRIQITFSFKNYLLTSPKNTYESYISRCLCKGVQRKTCGCNEKWCDNKRNTPISKEFHLLRKSRLFVNENYTIFLKSRIRIKILPKNSGPEGISRHQFLFH